MVNFSKNAKIKDYGRYAENLEKNIEKLENPIKYDFVDFLLCENNFSKELCYSDFDVEGFFLPYPKDLVKDALKKLYEKEVKRRNPAANVFFSNELETKIETVSLWLTTENKKRGLMFCGKVGNGKTTLLKAVWTFLRLVFDVPIYCEDFKYNSYFPICKSNDIEKVVSLPELLVFVDDIGEENKSYKEFGNTIAPMKDFLMKCYDIMQPLIITTNLDYDGLVEWYGERVADRCKEMFERIVFNEKSYRK